MYVDEEVVPARRKIVEEQHSDIYAGPVWIDGEVLDFEAVPLLAGTLTLMLPMQFELLPEELSRIKYPMESRPDIIISNDDTTVNIALSIHEDVEVDNATIEEAAQGFMSGLYRMYPSNMFFTFSTMKMDELKIALFDFKSQGVDADIYQLFAFFPFQGGMIQFVFNCPIDRAESWRPIVHQIIDSISDTSV